MAIPDPYDNVYPDRLAPGDNVLLDYTSKDLPTDIKELFNLVEYLAFNSGQVVSAIKKLTEFPITNLSFKTDNKNLRERHEEIAKKGKYKSSALAVGFDYNMYGNSLTSVYKPFIRYLVCPECSSRTMLKHADFSYDPVSDIFKIKKCDCGYTGKVEIEDRKHLDERKINIIRWDLRQIDIEYNEFSGKQIIYYTMSEEDKKKIKKNNIDILSTYPRKILCLAGKDGKHRFRFSDDYVYHMKTPCLSGISKVWGFPPCTPALKSFFYQFMLRKANEAVALDYLNHLRIIYPAMSQADNNPLQYINMSVWADEMSATIRKWRQDRNFVKLSPHPVGYQAIGGEGKALLLTNEIREASYDILLTLGIPRELMEGSNAQNMASPVLLRIVENMMLTYMEQLTDWVNWVSKQVSDWFGIEHVPVEFIPFKFIDDIQRKQLVMQWGQGGEEKKISDSTIAEQLDIDLDDEENKIVEDSIRQYRLQKDISNKINDLETSLAAQAEQQAAQASGASVDYNNQQQTIAQGDEIAMQLVQIPYEQRKSELLALQKEDYVMYSIVIQRMEEINNQMKNSAMNAAKLGSEKTASVLKEAAKGKYPDGMLKVDDTYDRLSKLELAVKSIASTLGRMHEDAQ